jgi:hypothetical protein
MKKLVLFFLCVAFATVGLNAQVPSISNLKHFYNFNLDGVPFDVVGEAHGDIDDHAVISGGVLDLTGGEGKEAYAFFPADEIAINTYSALTVEIWADGTGSMEGGRMMWCFGTAAELGTGGVGLNYLFFTPTRFGGTGAARISISEDTPWANEEGINFDNATDIYTEDELYHYVVTISEDNEMKVYVNGELLLIGADRDIPASTVIPETHLLSSVSDQALFIGRAVYAADDFWKGKVYLFGIWDAALSDNQVKWMYEKGKDREHTEFPDPTSVSDITNQVASIDMYTANNRLFVRNFENLQDLSITIYNIQGSVVYQTNAFENGKYLDFNQGIYLVKARSANNTAVQKIIVY